MAELVVYYSLTGKTRQVAEWLADGLKAEIEEIVERCPRSLAVRGIFRSGLDTVLRRRPPIRPMAHREMIFDRVILACPVWGGRMAAPARTWLHDYGRHTRLLGLALQSGAGDAHAAVIAEFAELTGHTPMPLLTVSEEDFGRRVARQKVAQFVRENSIEAARYPAN